jgi:hypothetical protein
VQTYKNNLNGAGYNPSIEDVPNDLYEEENLVEKQLLKWEKRAYSWSQHSQFSMYSKEEWYKRYILGERMPTTKEIDFGSAVDKRIQNDPTYIPQIPRGTSLQYTINVNLGDIPLVGLFDIFDENILFLGEIKTGKAEWNQKRADEHGQITLYCLLLYLLSLPQKLLKFVKK